jgi:hypothetical protein
MVKCRCPQCRNEFQVKTGRFGKTICCSVCSHLWVLNVDHIAKYEIPDIIKIQVKNREGIELPNEQVEVEYNYPILKLQTDSKGRILLTGDMIRKGLQDYVSLDGIMDHKGDNHACQRYIHLNVGSVKRSIDLSKNQKEIEVDIKV